ncbi:spermidine/putrescine ABC transporter ATP-binding protein [Salipaludibacillus neizhouensis]|uniref:Spermidine/putrescine ABC transporter ATP-binding protein n=1 Tax=Salipaludibacillus neizhouensis TaxID=885475 RepID=A0A3A9K8F1_9BACI|nr:ABC transporter ATP-binding protein [Salipaludibacillus neizhouensis]RKL66802.1 spermidine/putrescine ABC transporter ATP-binding protein [Salipaludibacillus neizhouensis]
MAILELQDVEKTFFSLETMTTAIENINLTIEKGEFISFIGPSGCGKTTLLSLVSGLILPTKGQIILDGVPIEKPTPETGYMLQQDYLFPWLSIEENILLGLKILDKTSKEEKERPIKLLEQLGLLDKLKNYPYELSGGMRQRVALVRMLSTDPELLLLDEPFSALDYQSKLKLEDLVFSTIRAHKKTAILVTHDIGEAIAMSDRIILLAGRPGRIQNEFIIPKQLSQELPFKVRTSDTFNSLFQKIWKEMESSEESS